MSAKNFNLQRKKMEDREIQTEATFHVSTFDIPKKLTDTASKQFEELKKLQSMIKSAMTEVGCSVYDLMAYKDVVMTIGSSLPDMPVNDLLLLSSKLFRRSSELGRLVGAFFNVVFAEDFVDEDFHFIELRMAQREISALNKRVEELEKEKHILQELYDELGKGSLDHAKAVEVLENRNDINELRSTGLEDQMAVLFQQLTQDLRTSTQQTLQQALDDVDIQEHLSSTRTQFVQSVDAVQSRLKFFQSLLLELQDDPIVTQDTTFRNKIKALDVHVLNIGNRFGAVREGLLSSSDELLKAIHDRRKALNFSVQHLKLSDLQAQKLRQARGTLHELRQRVTEVERTIQHSFPHGGLTRVERSGEIVSLISNVLSDPTSPTKLPPSSFTSLSAAQPTTTTTTTDHHSGGGGFSNDAADSLRKSKFNSNNVRHIIEQIQLLHEVVIRLTAYLDTEEEQKALLRTISLAAPTSGRPDVALEKQQLAQLTAKAFFPSAQALPQMIDSGRGGGPPQIAMRQSSIADVLTAVKSGGFERGRSDSVWGSGGQLGGGGGNGLSLVPSGGPSGGGSFAGPDSEGLRQLREDFTTRLNFIRDVYEDRISDLEARNDRMTKKLNVAQQELARVLKEEARKVDLADREATLRAKEAWATSREGTTTEVQPTRQTALQASREILHTQINFSEFSSDNESSRPQSSKTSGPSSPNSGSQAFISPQARLQVQRQNAERRHDSDKDLAVVFTATPHTKRGPIMKTDSMVMQQERNEQLIRAMRRLTGVEEFKQAAPVAASAPPIQRKMSRVGSGVSSAGSGGSVGAASGTGGLNGSVDP
ncbi:Hypothetical protein, putative [Bodo saltans]|uniref:Uncharacterized protein n=1 Tax=Bodo saltans TaxID=75058 RepID=A0A0S4KK15_BODSA|nr:Hypothetical protein, putative [Bodo saltans]|eukprot:CUI14743.1 Hypothetical protein, putative [Bodo saltans]